MNDQEIVYVEDDDGEVASLRLALQDAQIPNNIIHLSNGAEALAYARESTKEATVWIIDGRFPMTETEHPAKHGPEIAEQIRILRGERALIIGFSTDPDIFRQSEGVLTHNLHKGRPWESVPLMQQILRKATFL